MERKEQKHYKITFLMIYNTYFVGYIVSEISVEKWKLLTLIIHGTEKRNISSSVYPPIWVKYDVRWIINRPCQLIKCLDDLPDA